MPRREKLVDDIVDSRPARLILAAWQKSYPVRRPFISAWFALVALYALEKARYTRFVANESKRAWRWETRNSKEWAWWVAVFKGCLVFTTTVLWQLVTPPSISLCILVPAYISWALSEGTWGPFYSPVALACYVMCPLKFVPWAPISFFWTGIF